MEEQPQGSCATGTVTPVKLVQVGTQVNGPVQKLYVDFNDHVTNDQLVAQIDPAVYQASAAQSQANLAQSVASLESAKAKLVQADNDLARDKELAKRGMPTLELLGWQTPPFYNPQTHNLEWALRLRSGDGSEVVNYKTKLLGRHGVMDVVLVCDEKGMPTIVPEYQALLEGFSFKKEESYASFTKGDKIAEYGLTGLIVGGALLAAAKSGLLAKLWKPLVIGIAAIGTYLKRLFKGKNKDGTKEVI